MATRGDATRHRCAQQGRRRGIESVLQSFLRSLFMHRALSILAAAFAFGTVSTLAHAAEVKILTAGAMKAVVLELVPAFEKETGHKAVVDNDTAGGLSRRILGGEAFDLVVVTPGVIDDLG